MRALLIVSIFVLLLFAEAATGRWRTRAKRSSSSHYGHYGYGYGHYGYGYPSYYGGYSMPYYGYGGYPGYGGGGLLGLVGAILG